MSAAQTQKDSEGPWGLDSLGLSQRELVLAEALQMEYDALSRLKQDKGGDSQGTSSQGGGKVPTLPPWEGQRQVDRPLPPRPSLSPPGRSLLRGLSGSDLSLHHLQPGGSHSPQPSPARAREPIYILESPGKGDYLSSSYGESGSSVGSSLTLPKGFPPRPDDSPPAVPPRTPLLPSSEPFLPPRPTTTPRDVNLFTPEVDQPKLSSGETLNYESLNDALSKLNGDLPSPRGRRANGDQSGKPLARSKTLPPQVPPRTYVPIQKSNKNQHRVSADPVSLGTRLNGFGYELFQVSEERDEEVAAFCHMLDVLRSAYPCSDQSKNTGFVWTPSVGPEELQQGLGVSVKVTVISDHFREPLTFTCDGSSTVDLLIYQTLCYANEDLDHIDVDHYLLKICGQAEFLQNVAEKVVEKLTVAILDLVELYCSTFNANFHTTVQSNRHTAPTQEAGLVTNVLSFSVYAAHRIPITWAASYEGFFLSCSLTHGGAELCAPQHTSKQQVSKYLFHLVVWDQRVCFPVQINQLPRETQLTVTLCASALPPPGGVEEKGSKQRRSIESLGWVTMPLFNFRHILTCGRKLLGLWPSTPGSNARSSFPNFSQPDSIILQVDFPTSSFEVHFSTPPPAEFSPQYDFSRLDQHSQRQLQDVLHKKSLFWVFALYAGIFFFFVACLSDIYALLRQWACLNHHHALGLLHATFPDQELRHTAVQWMDSISDPELLDFLPQLVQALKYECYLDSPLVRFLLRRAIGDMRIAHYLFWLLKDSLQDSQFSGRYQHLLAGLLCCVGRGLREELDRQCWLITILAKVAQRVRDTSPSSRQAILREGLEEVRQFFSVSSSCRLPLNPGMLVKAINIQLCSYFNSNAVPLKLSFQNLDPLGDNINVIFKSGDDLRQDMLTLQIIRIMNKIWIQEGLDMRTVIFRCFSTGRGRGMVEMIPQAETLRKIQGEHGVTGSFKDRPLADWLQKHNPTEDEYEKAVENFIYSCAGCCVATYILGICDRHNDNIMLKTSGHMFHIDFGKFLGHAQMFGNIKRDRAPFVFTSDMAYVINGGDKPSSRFHDFVDLCCEAYNLIRKHTHLFLNLLGLMLSCGIPELSDLDDLKYVYDALRPHESEADATMYFTRLIESSLGSVATKLNFFIHNLAQMKFASSEEHPVLSFAPRVYTLKTDGLIRNLFVCRHIRTYSSSKGYAFVVKVEREGQQGSVLVQRSFEEFYELHSKLRLVFPSSKLPSFPSRFLIGRSRGEAMADRRKDELNGYVWHLVHAAPEVAQCDLIYTFFHPLQRDEKPGTVVNTLQSKPAAGLVYDRIPRGDLQQRVIHLRVLGDGAFWENTLLGEAFIPLNTLTPGQCWADWHQLGTPSTDSTH
nr:phosphatidylinositol 4-phosphate 3-kinase C2 domain-containing subunit beta-like [Oncorhynchus nerka]